MGSDKGLLPSPEGSWARTAMNKLTALNLPVVLSLHTTQYKNYFAVFPSIELITDLPELPFAGPLLALLTIHYHKPAEDLVVLACDMPLIQSVQLQNLIALFQQDPSFDAYLYSNDGAFEPLCALYTAKGLAALMQLSLPLKGFSMKGALNRLKTCTTPVPPDQMTCFKNINSRTDLGDIQRPASQIPPSP